MGDDGDLDCAALKDPRQRRTSQRSESPVHRHDARPVDLEQLSAPTVQPALDMERSVTVVHGRRTKCLGHAEVTGDESRDRARTAVEAVVAAEDKAGRRHLGGQAEATSALDASEEMPTRRTSLAPAQGPGEARRRCAVPRVHAAHTEVMVLGDPKCQLSAH